MLMLMIDMLACLCWFQTAKPPQNTVSRRPARYSIVYWL